MKLSRRKAMTAMVGGVAAAPQAMEIAANITKNNTLIHKAPVSYPLGKYNDKIDATTSLEERVKNYLQRKTNLENIIAGNFEPHELEEIENMRRFHIESSHDNINSLKSVAPVVKNIMKANIHIDKIKKDFINRAKENLKFLVDRGLPK